jgi:hypothetical protein
LIEKLQSQMTTFLIANEFFVFFCQNKKLINIININKNIKGKYFSIIINIFEINKRLLFFNKTICLSLINKKTHGTIFYQEKEIQDFGWGQRPEPLNQKSRTQQSSIHPLYIHLRMFKMNNTHDISKANPLYIHLRMFKMNNTHDISKANLKEKLHVAI